MLRLSLYPIADSYLLVAVVALGLLGLVVWLARGRGRRATTRAKRATLITLRLLVILLVIATMLRPTLVYTKLRKQSATLVILADQSRSMSVRDAVGGKSRWQALNRAIDGAQTTLAALGEDFQIQAYAFDAEAHPVDIKDGKIALPESPEGHESAIGSVLRNVLQEQEGQRLLGVILMSDGAQRAYAPRDLPAQTAAGLLKPMGTPLYTFGFGQSLGTDQARDVAVTELIVNESVFVKNDLPVSGQVRIDGYVGEVPVKLSFETAPGEMEVVGQQNVRPRQSGKPVPLTFNYAPQIPGEYKLSLEAVTQPEELVTTNNRLTTFVRVLKGGLRVLYLEGTPRSDPREQLYLRRSLAASPDIGLDYLLLDPAHPETRPGDFNERLKPGKYDVYILGNVDATVFQGAELQDLADTVAAGSGLIMLGGYQSFGPGGYATTPLKAVLPVNMNKLERQNPGEPRRVDAHFPGPLPMRPTVRGLSLNAFPLMLAADPAATRAAWGKLPPLDGANRFRPPHKPAAVVLADDGNSVPLLVAHGFGLGRAMAFAGDSTWRWVMRGYPNEHKRFWRQTVLWLARKDQLTEGNVWVRPAKRRFAPGERVEFVVGAQSPTGDPLSDAQFQVQVVLPDGKTESVNLVWQDQQQTGSFRQTRTPGDYAIQVTASHGGEILGNSRARFLVFQQDLELDNATADTAMLGSLAAMTGGESLAGEQLPWLIGQLTKETDALQVEEEVKQTLWDGWWIFLPLVALLGAEWYLRKRWGLV